MTETLARLQDALQDRYRLERELGQGGMATVYLAHDLKHDRQVALKVLRPELAAVLGAERFLAEIKITARLDHPHILTLIDSGASDGFLWYVLPFVRGESLRERLNREQQLPLEDALTITRQVAGALEHAHRQGVIHRDIKPENILFHEGEAMLADFGIALAVKEAGGNRLTETGLSLGTPQYMSPEQATGDRQLDARSDIYSLGAVLYEMLAGEPPVTGPTVQAVIAKLLTERPTRLRVVRDTVPEGIEAAVAKALAKAPADRFQSVAEFAATLAHPEALTGAAATRPRPWWRRRASAVTVLGAVVLAAAALTARNRLRRPEFPRTAIAVLPLENLSAQGSYAYFAGGLHDQLLTQLAKVAALTVIGRKSVMSYAGSTKRLREIGRELAVGSIVEGSVQVVGNRLRVNVQLIDPRTEAHVWAESYDRTLDDAFAVESEIAQRIVDAVGARVTTAEASAIAAEPTKNPEAYRLYLQAEEYRKRPGYTNDNLEAARALLERALALDSTFALAHASLSYVHGFLYWVLARPERAALQWAEAQAAVRLAPTLPAAHFAMGLALFFDSLRYAAAVEEFRTALRGQPNNVEFWAFLGYASASTGRWAEWEEAMRRATELDPRDPNLFFDLVGNEMTFLRRYAEAVAGQSRALVLAPDLAVARFQRAWAFFYWQGRLDSLEAALSGEPGDLTAVGGVLFNRVWLALLQRRPERLLALLPRPDTVVFNTQFVWWPALLWTAWAQRLQGKAAAARESFAGALRQADSALRALPNEMPRHAARGLALAGLGRTAEARAEADWLARNAETRGPLWGDYPRSYRAMILAQAGLAGEAVAALDRSLAGPSWFIATALLRVDPTWDPIRNDPRFRALLAKYGDPRPSSP